MGKPASVILAFFVIILVQNVSRTEEVSLVLEFSADTEIGNQISVIGPGFDSLPRAAITYGPIPSDNAFEGATDGRGATVSCAPGQGLMIFGPGVQSKGVLMIRCSVRTDNANAAITIASLEQSVLPFVATNTTNDGLFFLNRYRRLALLSIPSKNSIQPLIQVFNPSQTETLTAYIDNLEVRALEPQRYYSADFLNGDETDPTLISLTAESNPTPTLSATSTIPPGTATPGPSPTPTLRGSATPEPSATPTRRGSTTPRPSATPGEEGTPTPEMTATPDEEGTPTPEATATPDEEGTPTPEMTATPDEEGTPTPEATATPDEEGTPTPEVTATPDEEGTPTPEVTATPDEEGTPTLPGTATPALSATPTLPGSTTPAPSITPAPSFTPAPSPTVAPSATATPTPEVTSTPAFP